MKALVLAFIALALAASAQNADNTFPAILEQPIASIRLTSRTAPQAFAELAAAYRFPLGLEIVSGKNRAEFVRTEYRALTLRELLEELAGRNGYVVSYDNDVVHLRSKVLRDRQTFLDTKVDTLFEDVAAREASTILLKQLQHNAAPSSGRGTTGGRGLGDTPVSFSARNLPVRSILDELAKRSGLRIWVVTFVVDDDGVVLGTGSIFKPGRIHSEQPHWELLNWGYDPVEARFRPNWANRSPAAHGSGH